jgi:hypothetical protein
MTLPATPIDGFHNQILQISLAICMKYCWPLTSQTDFIDNGCPLLPFGLPGLSAFPTVRFIYAATA